VVILQEASSVRVADGKSGSRFCLGKHDKTKKADSFRFNLNRKDFSAPLPRTAS